MYYVMSTFSPYRTAPDWFYFYICIPIFVGTMIWFALCELWPEKFGDFSKTPPLQKTYDKTFWMEVFGEVVKEVLDREEDENN